MQTVEPERALWLAVDVIGSIGLLAAACFAVGVSWARPRGAAPFWLLAAAGLLVLAGDERFSLHERAGRWLTGEGVSTPFGLNHMDDAVLLAVALAGVAFVAAFWRETVSSRPFALLLGLAAAVSALALAIDGFAPVEGWAPRTEEPVELVAQSLMLTAFARRWFEVREAAGSVPARAVGDPVYPTAPMDP